MKIILYASNTEIKTTEHLKKIIEAKVPSGNIETFDGFKEFAKRIHIIKKDINLAILFAHNKGKLSELILEKDLLRNIPIILVLHNRKRMTACKARLLNPGFVEYADGDFSYISMILEKMITHEHQNQVTFHGTDTYFKKNVSSEP